MILILFLFIYFIFFLREREREAERYGKRYQAGSMPNMEADTGAISHDREIMT